MATMTRRKFITRTTAGAAVIGVVVGGLGGGIGVAAADRAPSLAPGSSADPLMVYVTDAAHGEVTFLQGQREVIRHDPALVARLLGYVV